MRDWKEELTGLLVIYRMLECGDRIPLNTDGTDYSFIEDILQQLFNDGLIDFSKDKTVWEPTQKAVDLRNKMLEVYDRLLKFEIFGNVNLNQELPEDISEDGISVLDYCYDPRFEEPPEHLKEEYNTQDLRLAMIDFLHENMNGDRDFIGEPVLNKHRLVFFQMLSNGEFNGDIWFDFRLGKPFDLIQEIVDTAYPWTAISPNREDAIDMMKSIYTSGMLEQRKRDGFECSKCGIPLGVFEENAKEEGKVLTTCPNPECGEPFIPPEPEGDLFECPNCGVDVGTNDHMCMGCGAVIDFSIPSGSVVEDTIIEEENEEPVWSGYYDYTPYGWYNPYDPYYDILAIGLVCAVLW